MNLNQSWFPGWLSCSFPRSFIGRICVLQQEVPTDSFAWKGLLRNDKAITDNPKTKEKTAGGEIKHSTAEERLNTSGLGSPYPNSTNGNCSYNPFGHKSQWAGGGSGWSMDSDSPKFKHQLPHLWDVWSSDIWADSLAFGGFLYFINCIKYI